MPIATTFLAASNSFPSPSLHLKSTNSSSHSQFCIMSKPLTTHNKITAAFNSMPEIALDRNDKRASTKASSISALEQLKISSADRYTKERSSIVLLGLNFHTAPLEMREKLAVPKDELPRAIEELCSLNHIEEAGVLSTCNRVEIYVLALSWHRGVREVMEWMAKTSGIPASQLRHHLLLLRDSDATKHLFQVSSGLDSLVLGEVQILAQIKQVLHCGNGVTGFGRHIGGLFQHASTVGGMVRDKTGIASGAVSISSAAVELAVLKLPERSSETARVLVVGAGNMGRLVIKHLVAKGWTKIVVCNRSEERVAATREELKGVEITYRPFTEMLACAANADVIFTSTSLKTLLFLKENVDSLPPVCDAVGGLRLFIDISAPRNVSTCVADVANTRLYNVDDLKEVVAINKEDRRLKAMEAHSIIAEESRKFGAWRDSLETVPTIKKLRGLVDGIRKKEIDRCVAKLGNNISPKTKKAIEDLSLGIMNKMLHGPMQHLRCDDGDKRTLNEVLENMYALNRIFSLETNASILEQKVRAKLDRTRRETQ